MGSRLRLCICAILLFTQNVMVGQQTYFTRPAPIQDSGIDTLVARLTEGLDSDSAKLRALHDWIADQVAYDVQKFLDSRYRPGEPEEYADPTQAPARVFRTRLAVCEGYANLLKYMCALAGIRAEVIEGQGRPEGGSAVLHGWNAVLLDGEWQLLDVTWAAGGVDLGKKKFIKKYDDLFFLMPPAEFIRTHYPSDPAWQLLNNPVTRRQFDKGRFDDVHDGTFAFADTLAAYEEADSLVRIMASLRRTVDWDPSNVIAKQNLESLANYFENVKMNRANRLAEKGVNDYNECVRIVNEARRRGDTRIMEENEKKLRRLIADCRSRIREALDMYATIRFTDRKNEVILDQNKRNMEANLKALDETEKYLDRYYSAPASERKNLL